MLQLLFFLSSAFAQPYFDTNFQAMVMSNTIDVCAPLLYKATRPVTLLPNPDAAFINYLDKQILFSVDPAQAGDWPRVTDVEKLRVGSDDAEQLKIESLQMANKKNVWIDVARGVSFASKIFELYESGPTIHQYCCVEATAAVSGLVDVKSILLKDYFTLQPYFESGFYEIDPSQKDHAEIGYVFALATTTQIRLRAMHAFIPFPGTEWAFDKWEWDFPRIRRVADMMESWPGIVRYLARDVDTRSAEVTHWYKSLTDQQNKIRRDVAHRYRVVFRNSPNVTVPYWFYALRPPFFASNHRPKVFEFQNQGPIQLLQFSETDYVFAFTNKKPAEVLELIFRMLQLYYVETFNLILDVPQSFDPNGRNIIKGLKDGEKDFVTSTFADQEFTFLRMTTAHAELFKRLVLALDQVADLKMTVPSKKLITGFAHFESSLTHMPVQDTESYKALERDR